MPYLWPGHNGGEVKEFADIKALLPILVLFLSFSGASVEIIGFAIVVWMLCINRYLFRMTKILRALVENKDSPQERIAREHYFEQKK